MTCHEFWTSENRDSSIHLEECTSCAAAWDREQALLLGLRIGRTEHRAVEAPPRLEGRLRAAFQGHAGLGSNAARPPAWLPVVTWISAAAALAMMAVLLVRDPEPKPAPKAPSNAIHFAEVPAAQESPVLQADLA